jgi:hypothetical protein
MREVPFDSLIEDRTAWQPNLRVPLSVHAALRHIAKD